MMGFYKNKKVFVTGHTGFKGAWLCKVLSILGSEVTGFALSPSSDQELYAISGIKDKITSVTGDVRDLKALQGAFIKAEPEIVIHLAAQPLVSESYTNTHYTYETNVMGVVNLFECIRGCSSVRSVLNVTTDKVYENKEWVWAYRENESLNGLDPYSNSKSCSELITSSYKNSIFANRDISISTARAGNVIGGGDFALNRIIPDCVKAAMMLKDINVRNPKSIRPYQHVLEAISAYLLIISSQYADSKTSGAYNIGPDASDYVTTGELADIFCSVWGGGIRWYSSNENDKIQEANLLKVDTSKIKSVLGWESKWDTRRAVQKTVEWSKVYQSGGNVGQTMEDQIKEYLFS